MKRTSLKRCLDEGHDLYLLEDMNCQYEYQINPSNRIVLYGAVWQ